MSNITNIKAREILDSRGNPAIEVNVFVGDLVASASVPSGASTGTHEALELRDGGTRYLGKGVRKAIYHVEKKIAPLLKGMDPTRQKEIDSLMIEKDGTKNKSKLGANAILGVSLAVARAGAEDSNLYLYEYLNELIEREGVNRKIHLPRAFFNVINGGKHADNKLSFQEFMIVPHLNSFRENLRVASEVYHTLKQDLHQKFGKGCTTVGDEGGFAPKNFHHISQVLEMLTQAIKDAGYKGKVDLAMDCAASEFYQKGKYLVDGKKMSKEQLLEFYLKLIKKYHLISIEDPFEQEDFKSYAKLKKKSGIQIVGDDLTVTNPERIKRAIKEESCNCLLLKVNQIGSLSEALEAVALAYQAGWKVMVSHRSGETEDTFIADLSVGIGCGMIKSGAPCRGERTAKYNQLLRIEEDLKRRK
ncbi:MAG: phosphopyruvate hydratase [Candidatus Woesearchaeota archaeon]